MRSAAGVLAALALALAAAGCGASRSASDSASLVPETITVNVPSAAPGPPVTATPGTQVTTSALTQAPTPVPTRRAPRSVVTPQAAAVPPLAPAVNARLNGVAMWVPYWSLGAGLTSVLDYADLVRVAHPFLKEINDAATVLDESGGEADAVSQTLAARASLTRTV